MASLSIELELSARGSYALIAGLDEAGRGALAGPVVAAAVVLPLSTARLISQLSDVNDSKQLSATNRARLEPLIKSAAVAYGIGNRTAQFIDRNGIIAATKNAMLEALSQINPPPEYLLIDGRIRLPQSPHPQQSIIRGDSKSLSIAAASILAKVARDRMMIALDAQHPEYGFAQHKGYGTLAHREAIARLGPTTEHRLTFAPMRTSLL